MPRVFRQLVLFLMFAMAGSSALALSCGVRVVQSAEFVTLQGLAQNDRAGVVRYQMQIVLASGGGNRSMSGQSGEVVLKGDGSVSEFSKSVLHISSGASLSAKISMTDGVQDTTCFAEILYNHPADI